MLFPQSFLDTQIFVPKENFYQKFPQFRCTCSVWFVTNIQWIIMAIIVFISCYFNREDRELCRECIFININVWISRNEASFCDRFSLKCDHRWENPASNFFQMSMFIRVMAPYGPFCVLLIYITCRIFCAKGITVSQIFCEFITFWNVGLGKLGKKWFLDIFEVWIKELY
jgi:hypothetical protein